MRAPAYARPAVPPGPLLPASPAGRPHLPQGRAGGAGPGGGRGRGASCPRPRLLRTPSLPLFLQSPPAQGETPAMGGCGPAIRSGTPHLSCSFGVLVWGGWGATPRARPDSALRGRGARRPRLPPPTSPPPLTRAALLFGTHSAAAKGKPSQVIKSLVAQPCRSVAC